MQCPAPTHFERLRRNKVKRLTEETTGLIIRDNKATFSTITTEIHTMDVQEIRRWPAIKYINQSRLAHV